MDSPGRPQHVDVLIVGAGISGIGQAYHLQAESPDRTYLILEGRADIGGTWDLFRYPGVRSDSDMHTLGFEFKPWNAEKAIADGPSIMAYLRETIAENGIDRHLHALQQTRYQPLGLLQKYQQQMLAIHLLVVKFYRLGLGGLKRLLAFDREFIQIHMIVSLR